MIVIGVDSHKSSHVRPVPDSAFGQLSATKVISGAMRIRTIRR